MGRKDRQQYIIPLQRPWIIFIDQQIPLGSENRTDEGWKSTTHTLSDRHLHVSRTSSSTMKHKLEKRSVWRLERKMWWVRAQPLSAFQRDGWWSGWCVMGGRRRGEGWRKRSKDVRASVTSEITWLKCLCIELAPHMPHAWVYTHTVCELKQPLRDWVCKSLFFSLHLRALGVVVTCFLCDKCVSLLNGQNTRRVQSSRMIVVKLKKLYYVQQIRITTRRAHTPSITSICIPLVTDALILNKWWHVMCDPTLSTRLIAFLSLLTSDLVITLD